MNISFFFVLYKIILNYFYQNNIYCNEGGVIIKKIFYFLLIILVLNCKLDVFASDTVKARIGNKFFDTLEEAIENASSNDTISLTTDINLDKSLVDGQVQKKQV